MTISFSAACGYLGFIGQSGAFRDPLWSIFTTSTTATLLFNILEMQVKILFWEKTPAAKRNNWKYQRIWSSCMHESLQQAVMHLLSQTLSSNQDPHYYSIFGCLLCETEICFLSHLSQFCFLETDRNSLNQFPTLKLGQGRALVSFVL